MSRAKAKPDTMEDRDAIKILKEKIPIGDKEKEYATFLKYQALFQYHEPNYKGKKTFCTLNKNSVLKIAEQFLKDNGFEGRIPPESMYSVMYHNFGVFKYVMVTMQKHPEAIKIVKSVTDKHQTIQSNQNQPNQNSSTENSSQPSSPSQPFSSPKNSSTKPSAPPKNSPSQPSSPIQPSSQSQVSSPIQSSPISQPPSPSKQSSPNQPPPPPQNSTIKKDSNQKNSSKTSNSSSLQDNDKNKDTKNEKEKDKSKDVFGQIIDSANNKDGCIVYDDSDFGYLYYFPE